MFKIDHKIKKKTLAFHVDFSACTYNYLQLNGVGYRTKKNQTRELFSHEFFFSILIPIECHFRGQSNRVKHLILKAMIYYSSQFVIVCVWKLSNNSNSIRWNQENKSPLSYAKKNYNSIITTVFHTQDHISIGI